MGEKVIQTEAAMLDMLLEEIANRVVPIVAEKNVPGGFLDLESASRFLGNMSETTIREKVAQRLLKAYKPGRHLMFDKKDLREFVARYPAYKK